jgi:hypothetical protein
MLLGMSRLLFLLRFPIIRAALRAPSLYPGSSALPTRHHAIAVDAVAQPVTNIVATGNFLVIGFLAAMLAIAGMG